MTSRLRSIGPGTITTCTFAGSGYGYALLWALLFSLLLILSAIGITAFLFLLLSVFGII